MQFKNIILSFVASAVVISAAAIPDLPALPTPALPTPALPTPALPTPAAPTPAAPTPALPTPALPTPAPPTAALPTPALPTPAAPTPAAPDTQNLPKPQVCIDRVNSWLKGNAPAGDNDAKSINSCAICLVYTTATCEYTPVDLRLVCETQHFSWCLYFLSAGPPALKPTAATTLPAPVV